MLDVTLHSRLRCDMSLSWFLGSPESPTIACDTCDPDKALDSSNPHGNTQPGDYAGDSDDAEEVSQLLSKFRDRKRNFLALLVPLLHDFPTPGSTRSVTFEGSRLARNVFSSADTVITQHPQAGSLSHLGSVQGNKILRARTCLASDQSGTPSISNFATRALVQFSSFSIISGGSLNDT
ncbi:BZ3500_MvSof-1268-A1-R1_Chr10-2g02821 [Microbotryum saponariae]|uniref:BZ3500_MvSof-1268-A1-R1_Chr10-2g02821 protein n=1 Tax=Microbotryum saponariae TaxID=289078 RepID=A0A2X0L4M8_9BASI|nr:BZ3501_MvSof-1269-A2-R1_Chr10-2g02411 [Microbotryum saponariae]SDA01591.1 BZ3500_MvSof-1268-A1-R1_Chr10-2g02821 [Microbotryum saponariae]